MCPRFGDGKGYKWIMANQGYREDACLIWPFKLAKSGYANFRYYEMHYAHRFMCELVNGPPPSEEYEAAHSCGRGNKGCVNPMHLSWKTRSENQLDKRNHGTNNNYIRRIPPLTLEEIKDIKKLAGKETKDQTAARYRISRPMVYYWQQKNLD